MHNECTYNDKNGESLVLYPVAHDDNENCCESELCLIIIQYVLFFPSEKEVQTKACNNLFPYFILHALDKPPCVQNNVHPFLFKNAYLKIKPQLLQMLSFQSKACLFQKCYKTHRRVVISDLLQDCFYLYVIVQNKILFRTVIISGIR